MSITSDIQAALQAANDFFMGTGASAPKPANTTPETPKKPGGGGGGGGGGYIAPGPNKQEGKTPAQIRESQTSNGIVRDIPNASESGNEIFANGDMARLYAEIQARGQGLPDYHYGENLARPGANVAANMRGSAETLRRTRLMDRLNNRIYISPANIGYRNASMFGNANADHLVQLGNPYQMPTATSEDMRQQARNAELQQEWQKAKMARQQEGINLNTIERDRAEMKEALVTRRNLRGEALRRAQQEVDLWVHTEKMRLDLTYRKEYTEFERRLQMLEIPFEQYNTMVRIARSGPMGFYYASMLAGLFQHPGMGGIDAMITAPYLNKMEAEIAAGGDGSITGQEIIGMVGKFILAGINGGKDAVGTITNGLQNPDGGE